MRVDSAFTGIEDLCNVHTSPHLPPLGLNMSMYYLARGQKCPVRGIRGSIIDFNDLCKIWPVLYGYGREIVNLHNSYPIHLFLFNIHLYTHPSRQQYLKQPYFSQQYFTFTHNHPLYSLNHFWVTHNHLYTSTHHNMFINTVPHSPN
jgi:hypothetical protein